MKKILVVLISACGILYACKKGNENFVSSTTMLNAAIDMPAITLNLNGNPFIANLPFDSIRYNVSNSSGTFTLHFTASGIYGLPDSGINTDFSSGNNYTCIVYDSAKPSLTADFTKIYFQKDILPTSVTDGKCSLRFFDLVPDIDTLKVFMKVDTGSSVIAGKYYYYNRSFGDFGSSNAFAEADTTTLWLKVVKDTSVALGKALDSTKVGLKNGKIYSIYLVGAYGETGAKKPKLIVQQHN